MFEGFTEFTVSTTSTDPIVEISGVRGGSGPPLLLLHGFPQTLAIWHKVVPTLKSHFTVIAINLRGYGASSKPPAIAADDHSLYAKSALAHDCIAVMKAQGFSRFAVLGHDRGGRVAHKLCVDHPAAVSRLLLLDICPTLAMFEATDQRLATAAWHWFFLSQPAPFPESVVLSNPRAFTHKLLSSLTTGRPSAEVFSNGTWRIYDMQLGDPDSVHAMCEDYRAGANEDLQEQRADRDAGRKIQCPVMLLWGSATIAGKFDVVKEWEKVSEPGLVDARSLAMSCGHYIPEEAPEELLKHALPFFSEESPPLNNSQSVK